jgi:hypothetical protein
MSDIAASLLDAIDTYLATATSPGGTLEAIKAYAVLRTSAGIPPNLGMRLPLLLVEMGPVEGEIISIPVCMTRKTYPIRYSIYTRNAGDTLSSTALDLLDDLENLIYNETFSLAQWIDFGGKSYEQPNEPPFSGEWNGFAQLLYNYIAVDMRTI